MRFALRLSLALSLGLAAAQEMVGNWTLSGLSRTCTDAIHPPYDENRCAYSFFISESADPAASKTQCTVWAYSRDLSATQMAFSNYPCREGGAASVYNISNGWDPAGFITITVLNYVEDVNAYFSFMDSELANQQEAPSKTEPAYKCGPLDTDGGHLRRRLQTVAGRRLLREEGEEAKARDGPVCDPNVWVVKNLSRNARPVLQAVLLRFDLFRCDEGTHCKLDTMGESPTMVEIKYDNFSDVACADDAPYIRVSWRYKPDSDGAVMTLEDSGERKRAFFGWQNVNGRIKFAEGAEDRWEAY